MSKFQTEQKLELIRAIRMQNQYDRQTLHRRENLLYAGSKGKSELYSLEDTVLPSLNANYKEEQIGISDERNLSDTGTLFSGARIRLAIAMVLFLAFVYCDVKELSIGGKTSIELLDMLQEDGLHTAVENIRETIKL